MKHFPSEKYNIAWFKLSQLVSRGEKEKALGLYRLLSHSLDDKAYALQVEGDILWSFDDELATIKYEEAAFLYKKENKIVSAVGVYEHLLILDNENFDVLEILLECYSILDWSDKVLDRTSVLIEFYRSQKVSKDRVLKILQLICNTYKSSKNEKSYKKFTTFLKAQTEDIAILSRFL